jgi:hypothetical protein
MVDYMALFAPKPSMVLAGRFDFIYFQGTKDGAAQMKQVYDELGAADNFGFFVADDGHGISKPKREAVLTFFLKHLCGTTKNIVEPDDQSVQPESALNCTRSGSVNLEFPDEITIQKRNLQLYSQYQDKRNAFCLQDKSVIQSTITDLLSIDYPTHITIEKTEMIQRNNYSIQKIIIHSDNQPPLPCLFFIPNKPDVNPEIVLYADGNGKNKAAIQGGQLDSLASNGQTILAFDMRGTGETADAEVHNDPKFLNKEYRNAVLALYNGKPLMGQRVTDVFMALDFIYSDSRLKNKPVRFIAKGNITPAALHAAFLDKRISKLVISGNINSWKQYLDNPVELNQQSQVIPGVLQYYDLPDLVSLLKGTVSVLKK